LGLLWNCILDKHVSTVSLGLPASVDLDLTA
jgi:hypothetical protein